MPQQPIVQRGEKHCILCGFSVFATHDLGCNLALAASPLWGWERWLVGCQVHSLSSRRVGRTEPSFWEFYGLMVITSSLLGSKRQLRFGMGLEISGNSLAADWISRALTASVSSTLYSAHVRTFCSMSNEQLFIIGAFSTSRRVN